LGGEVGDVADEGGSGGAGVDLCGRDC
jgi:hypothetical protein